MKRDYDLMKDILLTIHRHEESYIRHDLLRAKVVQARGQSDEYRMSNVLHDTIDHCIELLTDAGKIQKVTRGPLASRLLPAGHDFCEQFDEEQWAEQVRNGNARDLLQVMRNINITSGSMSVYVQGTVVTQEATRHGRDRPER